MEADAADVEREVDTVEKGDGSTQGVANDGDLGGLVPRDGGLDGGQDGGCGPSVIRPESMTSPFTDFETQKSYSLGLLVGEAVVDLDGRAHAGEQGRIKVVEEGVGISSNGLTVQQMSASTKNALCN